MGQDRIGWDEIAQVWGQEENLKGREQLRRALRMLVHGNVSGPGLELAVLFRDHKGYPNQELNRTKNRFGEVEV